MDMITDNNLAKGLKTLATARKRLYERALEHDPYEERTITLKLPGILWDHLEEKADADMDGNVSATMTAMLWNDRLRCVDRMERLARYLEADEAEN